MKKILTFLIFATLLACSEDDTNNQQAQNNSQLEGGTIYTAQIVEINIDTATSETYQGTLGDKTIELRRTTENSLVFFVEPDFVLGNTTLTVAGLNNLTVNYNIEATLLTQTVTETIQPYFDQIAAEKQAFITEDFGDKAIQLIDGFTNLYATLNDQQKEDISLFYKANKNLIDATIIGDVNKFNSNVVTQFSRCKASIYLTGILGVFTTISTTLPFTQIATPILAVSTGILLAKTYEHCSSLASESIKNVFVQAEDQIFNSRGINSPITFNNDVARDLIIQIQNRNMQPNDVNDSNIIISTYFSATNDFNALVIQKMNIAINYLNTEWSIFFNITPYEVITANAAPETQTDNITDEDYNNFTFSVSNSNLNLETISFSNGGINAKIKVIDQTIVTNNLETGTLNFTYQDDFNNFSGEFEIAVRAGFDIFTDAAALKIILEANAVDVSDPRWDTTSVTEIQNLLFDLYETREITFNGMSGRFQTLRFTENTISVLPAEISELTDLITLNLNENLLTTIPAEIGQLTKLVQLYIEENELSSIPSEIGLLSNLEALYLSDNQLSSLPSEIGNLTNLTFAGFSTNQLTSLPSSIGNLTNIVSLGLAANQLNSIPSSLSNLNELTALNVAQNQLSTIPSEIGNMSNLNILDLGQNNLISVPSTIGTLTNLSSFSVFSNQTLKCLPPLVWDLNTIHGVPFQISGSAINGINDTDCSQ